MLLPLVPSLLLILQPLHQRNKPLTRLVFTDWWHVGGLRCVGGFIVPRKGEQRVGGKSVLHVRLNSNGSEHAHSLPTVVHGGLMSGGVAISHGRPLLRREGLPIAKAHAHCPQGKTELFGYAEGLFFSSSAALASAASACMAAVHWFSSSGLMRSANSSSVRSKSRPSAAAAEAVQQ